MYHRSELHLCYCESKVEENLIRMPPGFFPVESTSDCEETPGQIKNTEEGRRIPPRCWRERLGRNTNVWANERVSCEKWMNAKLFKSTKDVVRLVCCNEYRVEFKVTVMNC